MDKEALFRDNIARLGRITPDVALRVQYHDPASVSYAETRQGELNLIKDGYPLHASYSAAKEAERWFNGLKLDGVEVLYVFGVGLGYYYDAIKPWLQGDPARYVVFLEDDMSVLHRLLETERGKLILDDMQVQLHYFHDLKQGLAMFDWVSWYFVGMQPDVTALEAYERERPDMVIDVKRKILHDLVTKESVIAEYMRYGSSFFRNYYVDALDIGTSYSGNRLFGKFKGVPAIICGAGPSLNKNFDLLSTLSDRALILAGGSSLNALSTRGFLPHFAGGIDPNLPQYERLISNHAYEVPFFYRGRMHYKAFQTIHGPRLYVNGTGGYHVSDWLEEKLGIKDETYVDEGHNVINFLISVAMELGCSPIILVGMDLAFTGMKSYAAGVVSNAEVKEKDILNVRDLESGAFLRDDINGQPVYTLWKWVSESHWVSEFAKEHKERTQLINATEGGLGFEDIPNMTLKEVTDRYLTHTADYSGWVHSEIQQARVQGVTFERVLECYRELRDGLTECEKFCEGFDEEISRMEELVKKGRPLPPNLQTGKGAFYDVELRQHPVYQSVLAALCMAKTKSLDRRSHRIRYDWTLRSERDKNNELLAINREKTQFIAEAARVNRQILEESVKLYGEETGADVSTFFVAQEEKV